jgi:hypothetical protein
MRIAPTVLAIAIAASASARPVASEEPDVPVPEPESRLDVEVRAGVWIPRLDGTVRLGDGPLARSIDVDDRFDLDDIEYTPNADLIVRKDDFWQIRITGFDFSTDQRTRFIGSPRTFGSLLLVDGTPYKGSIDMYSVGADLAADCFHVVDASTVEGPAGDLRFAPLVGYRFINVRQDIDVPGQGSESIDADWGALYAGAEMRMRYEPTDGAWLPIPLNLEVSGGAGPMIGGDGGLFTQLRATVQLELTHWLTVMAGFRLFELDGERDDYEFDAGLEGLFFSGSIRF